MNYFADGQEFLYPVAGDPRPPEDHKVILLTKGGVCVVGSWNDFFYLGWLPLPKRNKDKELQIEQIEASRHQKRA
jgi:hypothetical protein